MNALKFIGRYLSIGVLIGLGILAVDLLTLRYVTEQHIEQVEEVKASFEELFEQFYQPGYESFWDRLENERPEALLTFNLDRVTVLEEGLQVSGVVNNSGSAIFRGFTVEVEALSPDGTVFAECTQMMPTLDPGARESVLMDCPYANGVSGADAKEFSFRVIRSFSLEEAIRPEPNTVHGQDSS